MKFTIRCHQVFKHWGIFLRHTFPSFTLQFKTGSEPFCGADTESHVPLALLFPGLLLDAGGGWCLSLLCACAPLSLCTTIPVQRYPYARLSLCSASPVHHYPCAPLALCTASPVQRYPCARLALCSASPVHRYPCAQG